MLATIHNASSRRAAIASGRALERLIENTAAVYEREGLAHLEKSSVATVFGRDGQPIKAGAASGDFVGVIAKGRYPGSGTAFLLECKHRPRLWYTATGKLRDQVNLAALLGPGQRERMDAWARAAAAVYLIVECYRPNRTAGSSAVLRLYRFRWNISPIYTDGFYRLKWLTDDNLVDVRRGVYDVLGLL